MIIGKDSMHNTTKSHKWEKLQILSFWTAKIRKNLLMGLLMNYYLALIYLNLKGLLINLWLSTDS